MKPSLERKAKNPFEGMGKLFKSPQVWFMVLATIGINSAASNLMSSWGPTMMTKALGFTTIQAGNVIMISTITSIVSAFALGIIIKKFGMRKIIITSYGLFGFAMLLLAMFLPKLNFITIAGIYIVLGIAAGWAFSAMFSLARVMVTNIFYGTCIGLINFTSWLVGAAVVSQLYGVLMGC